MKKTLLSISILTSLCSFSSFAELSDEAGFGGEISLNTGVFSQTSNLNTDNEDALTDLNSEGESSSEFMVLPLGTVSYTFGQDLNH